jgi:hypothetical protein
VNEDISDKSIRFAVRGVTVTAKTLFRACVAWKRHHDNKVVRKQQKKVTKAQIKAYKATGKEHKKGKQTVKELIGQNQGVSSMEVGDSGIRDFKKIANKYGVDFAIVKDKEGDPPKYTVFFKARDADAITQVLKEYGIKQTKKKEKAEHKRPSILKKLKLFKEKVAANPKKHREKRKEQER